MSFIAPLFIALAELVASKRSPKAIADQARIPLPDLIEGFQKIEEHFWHGRLARALEKPSQRPELIPLLTDLVRLEDHYADLMFQYRRAEYLANEANNISGAKIELRMKANSVAFRIHSAATRVLRDLQKSRAAFEKAEKPQPEILAVAQSKSPKLTPAAANSVKANPAAPTPEAQTQVPEQTPAQTSAQTQSVESMPNQPTSQPTSQPPQIEIPANKKCTPQPTDPFIEECLFRNRRRIQIASPKERPALIEKIIAEERAKQSRPAA